MVLHEHRVVIEPLQAVRPQQMGELIAPRLVLAIGDDPSRLGHDEAGSIGMGGRMNAWIHRIPFPRTGTILRVFDLES